MCPDLKAQLSDIIWSFGHLANHVIWLILNTVPTSTTHKKCMYGYNDQIKTWMIGHTTLPRLDGVDGGARVEEAAPRRVYYEHTLRGTEPPRELIVLSLSQNVYINTNKHTQKFFFVNTHYCGK